MLDLSGIHFLVTYRCLYQCDHCFVWGCPDQEGTMTIAQLRDVIDQAVALGTIDSVYFEGGEPTLVYPVVVSAARHARERGLDFGLVTNSQFAESVEDAAVWLAPFAELGIADLSLSAYPYFTAVIEPRLLRNTVEAALGLGLGDALGVLEVGAAADLADLGVACGDPGAIMYKGRAARVLAPEHASRPPETLVTCPYEDFVAPGRCHVGCDGELQPCQGISAGNIFAELPGTGRGRLRPGAAAGGEGARARRSVGAQPGDRPRPRARPLRRRVPPLLRAALPPARPLP